MRRFANFWTVLAAATGAATSAPADETAWQAGTADFVRVCVAALLAPDELPAALKDRDMTEFQSPYTPQGWSGALYQTINKTRGVSLTRQLYSDLTITYCAAGVPHPATHGELDALRARIEADPHINKLEGNVLDASPTMKIAALKRPGNAPIVTFNLTSSATITSLSMTRSDLK